MSEKWLLSRCEGYAVRIDESAANCPLERVTRLIHSRNDPQGTPREAASGEHRANCLSKT